MRLHFKHRLRELLLLLDAGREFKDPSQQRSDEHRGRGQSRPHFVGRNGADQRSEFLNTNLEKAGTVGDVARRCGKPFPQ